MTESDNIEMRGFLGDTAVVELRRLIATGALAPGERIVERDLASRLGVSRGPIRDAIKTLHHEGLVEVRPFAGACVATIDRDEIDEIVALRRQVEYFSIAGATLRATGQDIAGLRQLARKMGPAFAAGRVDELLDLDLGFHLAICDAAHHGTLAAAMRMLYPRLSILFYPQMLRSHTPETFEQSHHDLVDAIEGGEVDASLGAIDEHIDSFYSDVELRIDGGRQARRATYHDKIKPARPVAVLRRRGTLD
ncbi:GntR family transcriptional regulator [Pseudonocardia acaciae]|uniref:GntR family transcriptional regulator n=1 Tax=Pseudonocardia acaciae TaxID=551276 RepID=UPI0014706BC6|nr:GntR family transcriptional regulator [Pseudonocardia acaciae]